VVGARPRGRPDFAEQSALAGWKSDDRRVALSTRVARHSIIMSAISATLGAAVRRAPAQFRARAPKASASRAFTVRAMAGKEVIATDKSPAALGPYSQAIRAGNTLYVSGQIGLKAETMEFAGDTIEEQTEQVMANMGEILKAAGADFKDVVKTTILLADMGDFKTVNEIYGKRFPENPPARATFAVKTLPLNALVEIDCTAYLP
jgi:2-iminobutanoate/2-iminopropanoate deaminase